MTTDKGKILVVDDTPAALKLLTDLLIEQGYEVRSAISGELALRSASSNPPDLVLLDIRMPVMDGYEVNRRLKAQPETRDIPVIFVSAASETEEKVRGFEMGAVDFVTKPYQREELLARVRTHFELAYLRKHLADVVEERTSALRESEARYKRITEGLTDYQYSVRLENGLPVETVQSPTCLTVTGYTAEEFAANPDLWLHMVVPDDRELVSKHVSQILAGGDATTIEHRIIRKDGDIRWVSDKTIQFKDASGRLLSYDGVIKDVTELKQAEVKLHHANRVIATVSAVNRQLVYATDENKLLQAICKSIVEQRGYRMAWVGYVQYDESKSVKVMTHADHDAEANYLHDMHLTWAEIERGMEPVGRAIRSGKTELCQNIETDPCYLPWRDELRQLGLLASIALPLTDSNGNVFGILTVYADEINAFIPYEIDLLEEMAGDLAFGVRTLRIRLERDQVVAENLRYLEQLQDSLEDTVHVISSIVELRDPYTSGHQTRVARLAVAIAKQLGLSDEMANAIHLAGIVHDLGKIQVPSEILSKPGKISELEFSFIKTHAQAGYDILKNINFTSPIAQMVLQHHERLDGSGYPQGLTGEAILLEARILCVADVVEAMSSHRPYRAALGTELALEEITKQSGIKYDPQVVDACLTLFRDYKFSFKV
jgi:PAS domain S-box-containing protein/putative nucleotidyltransferase with HDIG domain